MGRNVALSKDGARWEYDWDESNRQSLLLTTALFHHIYYSYVSKDSLH
jgi:hypothetical protein